MMEKSTLRKADVITSGILIALGLAVIVSSLGMPMSGTHGGVEITWYLSPATFPLIVGALIVVFAVAVLVRAIRGGALDGFREFAARTFAGARSSPVARRAALIVLLMIAYVAFLRLHPFGWTSRGLVRLSFMRTGVTRFLLEPSGINYLISSFAFLAVFINLFYRPEASRRRRWAIVLGVSFATAFLTGYVFREQLLVPLP